MQHRCRDTIREQKGTCGAGAGQTGSEDRDSGEGLKIKQEAYDMKHEKTMYVTSRCLLQHKQTGMQS